MNCSRRLLGKLFVSTVLSAAAAMPALAQEAANANALEEVVVTATRQADTVNRVPLSVSAVTQRTIDQQGIKSVADLGRTVPALTIDVGNNGGLNNITIRGIQTTAGAPTTGVYLDDTPLTKRNVAGPGAVSNGTPTPPLFDLERVEVLRGPQGTLFGGSSEGGTVRFITPTPSLTRYSAYSRAEASVTRYGEPSYEGGIAVGGPIVNEKLGFRISGFGRYVGGFVDKVNPYTRKVIAEDTNATEISAFRGVLMWAPTERSRVSASYYLSSENQKDQAGFNLPVGSFSTPQRCFNTRAPIATNRNPVACPANAIPAGTTPEGIYMRPGFTYGPFDWVQPFQSFNGTRSRSKTLTELASLTIDYDFDHMSMKAITSYIYDNTHSFNFDTSQVTASNGIINAPGGVTTTGGPPIFALLPDFPAVGAQGLGPFDSVNRRYGITQELRFSSAPNSGPLTWVAGVYYANIRGHAFYDNFEDLEGQMRALFGLTAAQRYGVGTLPNGSVATRYQTQKDIEIAAFGEGTYAVTEQLKVIAGARVSRVDVTYFQAFEGTLNQFLIPTTENGGLTNGGTAESPVTPRVGLQYQITGNDMVYLNAARGYRAGGVNAPLPVAVCTGLATQGLTTLDIPTTYGSDSVWSYEGGAKLRILDNRVQLNGSVFRIDWSDVQVAISTAGCGPTYTMNAGTARSEGFDLEAQARVLTGLTLEASLGYTKARYTEDALGPTPRVAGVSASKAVNKGDTLPVPPWTVSLGFRYERQLTNRVSGYLRADYRYQSKYFRSLGPGVNAYAPDTRQADASDIVNARVGAVIGNLDINLFANNLFDSKDLLSEGGGRSGCTLASGPACTAYTTYNPLLTGSTFRPRTIGVQVSYRY